MVGVSRAGRDLMVDSGRESDPFAGHVQGPGGHERLLGKAVVDVSGTWTRPNPLGADGFAALGEIENADHISYGIPDFNDAGVIERYAGKHVAVADSDQLEQRGKLGQDAKAAATSGPVTDVTQFRTTALTSQADGRLSISSTNGQQVLDVDEIIVVTGFRPELGFLSEVRLDLDPPTVSHHLKVLHEAGLINREKRGTWVYYIARPEAMTALASLFTGGGAVVEGCAEMVGPQMVGAEV